VILAFTAGVYAVVLGFFALLVVLGFGIGWFTRVWYEEVRKKETKNDG